MFPFQLGDEVYDECIWVSEIEQSVCSTKVDANGVHVQDPECQSEDCTYVGFCGPNCPGYQGTKVDQGKEINPTAATG